MAEPAKPGVSDERPAPLADRAANTAGPRAAEQATSPEPPEAESQALEPGLRVGNYVIESLIGSGGMAQVYRVRHAVLGTPHALKVLAARYRGFLEVRQRFLSEGQIAAQLGHRHIVQVSDAVATPEVAGLVMDLVEGPTLETYVRDQPKPLPLGQVRELFLPVLDALAEAHRRGIIHRDIKPANILLDLSQGRPVPKLTDFGIAKVLRPTDRADRAAGHRDPTRAEARMGTLSYMSPEQVRGARDVSAQSDIFSLGATLYELCTGELPFDGDSEYEVMRSIVEGRLFQPERLAALDPVLQQVIRKALAPQPADRFASCEEFALALMARSVPVAQPGQAVAPPAAARAPASGGAPPASAPAPASTTRRCPFCNEVIQSTARKCKHCQEYLDPTLRRQAAPAPAPAPESEALIPTVASLMPGTEPSRIRPALLNLFVPGLGQLAHGSYKLGASLLGGMVLLHAYGASSAMLGFYHVVVSWLTYRWAARWMPTTDRSQKG
ncbi:MAG: protein kinase [Polyangia bacterium]